ncbi:hypothetical protein Bbelb_027930 [Branchiostoma belcheri]|nr:hypothetical protein Bbelb_027930 [Branchiostoma belcheri]
MTPRAPRLPTAGMQDAGQQGVRPAAPQQQGIRPPAPYSAVCDNCSSRWTTTTWTATNNDAVPASTASSSTATTSAGHTAPSSTTSAERTATGSTALAANRLRDIGREEGGREFYVCFVFFSISDRALCRHFVFADTFGRTTSTSTFASCMSCSSLFSLRCSLVHFGGSSER